MRRLWQQGRLLAWAEIASTDLVSVGRAGGEHAPRNDIKGGNGAGAKNCFNVIARPAHLVHAGRGNLSGGREALLAAREDLMSLRDRRPCPSPVVVISAMVIKRLWQQGRLLAMTRPDGVADSTPVLVVQG